jgi:putative transposase
MKKQDFSKEQMDAIKIIARNSSSIEEAQATLRWLIWPVIQEMMEAEMEEHLWYEKHSKKWVNSWNNRNWTYKKKILTWTWHEVLEVPRDRKWDYEPQILPKYETRTNEMETKIINMYWLWLTTNDIKKHIFDIYGADISKEMVSRITDKILPLVKEWQNKPLEDFYPILWLDAIHFKIRDNHKIENKWVYVVMWISKQGKKEVLWLYVWENESASFWQSVVNNISNRWVKDVCIACIDWLTWFWKAIKVIFPDIEIQRCIIHQIRYTMSYISNKDKVDFMKDLKKIYQAENLEIAEENLDKLEDKWMKDYPISVRSWRKNWEELSTYFVYSHHLRRIIYTTNTIESYNRQLRKVTKNRSVFPTVKSLEKLLYLATKNIEEKWWQKINNWWQIIWQFDAFFPEKVKKYMDL